MKPIVGVIMGSDSDLHVMAECGKVLKELDVSFEMTVVSAHRTPNLLYEYAKSARSRGIKVIVAGAGGAAHLPGMVAAMTSLPVIGVPVRSRTLNGIDSMYSILQMPPGVPVATVAINGAKNAGLLATQILGVGNQSYLDRIESYKREMEMNVLEKAERLESVGFEAYDQEGGN